MINNIRILAPYELKGVIEIKGGRFAVKTEFFNDGKENLIEKVAFIQPDAVIMNLFMPSADAIEIIKAYRLLYADSSIYFAVIVPFMTGTLKKEMEECGVRRIICAPYSTRDFLSLISEIAQRKATPLATLKSAGINTVHMLHHNHRAEGTKSTDEEEREIDEVFDALGLNENDVGCDFLRRAVMIALDGENNDFGITKRIYPIVAQEFGTTPSCVERRIRSAIYDAWRSEHSAVITSYFGYTVDNMRGRPTNSEFIAALADRIKLEMK